jgi:hypothetical protein
LNEGVALGQKLAHVTGSEGERLQLQGCLSRRQGTSQNKNSTELGDSERTPQHNLTEAQESSINCGCCKASNDSSGDGATATFEMLVTSPQSHPQA